MRKLTLGLVLSLVLALALVVAPACGGDGGAEFELSGLSISPSSAGIGESVTISATVKNTGDDEGSEDIALKVDGDEVDTKAVTVAAGASKSVTFSYTTTAEGTYAIKVDGLSGTLIVTAAPPGPTVTYTTYTDPEYGFSIDVPDDWVSMTHEEIPAGVNAETGETIWVSELMPEMPDLLPYYLGWRSPTPEVSCYPHMTVPVYALPMPFPPEGFWNLMLEPDGFYDLFPELDIVMAEGVRTAEDRAAYWASFTWTDADGRAIRTIVCFVSKAGNMYMLGGLTTQDTWDQYKDIFEHVVLSFKVPQ